MIRRLPATVRDVLERGTFCYLAAATARGPHLTPVVYALHASRLWVTTSRRSVKAGAWKRDPRVGGLVRAGRRAVSFTGEVQAYDLLDPSSWVPSLVSAPTITRAAVAFTRKNARFFAGYAVDARHVPLAWTPPGRMFVAVRLLSVALLDADAGDVVGWWDGARRPVASRPSYRASSGGWDVLGALPREVADRLGRGGDAVLALAGEDGPHAVPARWAADHGVLLAAAPVAVLELAGAGPEGPVALTVDRSSSWRARAMTGAMLQGHGSVHVPDRLRTGSRSAATAVERTGLPAEGSALVRIRLRRAVWWRGWSSGTVSSS